MKRVIMNTIFVLVLFLLQSTVFKWLSLANIGPNLLIVITASCGFMHGKNEGMLVGFFCGLLIDIFSSDLFGFYALVYMVIGYLNGFFNAIFYEVDIKLPMILIAVSELFYGIVIYLFLFLLRNRLDFMYYFVHIIVPELLYTIVITIILYRVILVTSQFVDSIGRRGDKKIAE